MNPGFKYPIDESVLRSKLLETPSTSMDQAWEKFEVYLSQQKPIFTEAKRNRIYFMIHPKLLLRVFLACLIILPSLLFYRQFNSKIPQAIAKVSANTEPSRKKNIEQQISPPAQHLQMTEAVTEPIVSTLPPEMALVSTIHDQSPKRERKRASTPQALPVQETSALKAQTTSAAETKTASSISILPENADPSEPEPTEEPIENPL